MTSGSPQHSLSRLLIRRYPMIVKKWSYTCPAMIEIAHVRACWCLVWLAAYLQLFISRIYSRHAQGPGNPAVVRLLLAGPLASSCLCSARVHFGLSASRCLDVSLFASVIPLRRCLRLLSPGALPWSVANTGSAVMTPITPLGQEQSPGWYIPGAYREIPRHYAHPEVRHFRPKCPEPAPLPAYRPRRGWRISVGRP